MDKEPGGLQSMESQRVGHDWSNWACCFGNTTAGMSGCNGNLLTPPKPVALCRNCRCSFVVFYSLTKSATFLFFFHFLVIPRGLWVLVPWPGIKPVRPALAAQSLNHWTTREVPTLPVGMKLECVSLHSSGIILLWVCSVASVVSDSLQRYGP